LKLSRLFPASLGSRDTLSRWSRCSALSCSRWCWSSCSRRPPAVTLYHDPTHAHSPTLPEFLLTSSMLTRFFVPLLPRPGTAHHGSCWLASSGCEGPFPSTNNPACPSEGRNAARHGAATTPRQLLSTSARWARAQCLWPLGNSRAGLFGALDDWHAGDNRCELCRRLLIQAGQRPEQLRRIQVHRPTDGYPRRRRNSSGA
jgi:hypothetical protein